MKKYLFFILLLIFIITPIVVFAAEWKWGDPLVICGTSKTLPCTLCDIFRLAQIIVKFITTGLFIIAPIFIVIGGIRILVGGAKPDEVQSGKKMITNAIIGIVIALAAWVVINMIFNQLAKAPGEEGIPWPWHEIDCKGGGIIESKTLTYCHIQYRDQNDIMAQKYENNTLCSQGCEERCIEAGALCEDWCCLDRDLNGKDNVCEPVSEQWCRRQVSVDSKDWVLSLELDERQKGDASGMLIDFLKCMFGKIPSLVITSISDNKLCSDPPACNPTTGIGCSHTKNSCHYGGTKCAGYSYAVDFRVNVTCKTIADTASQRCNPSGLWVLWEDDHTHVSINGGGCGCNERREEETTIDCKGH